MTALRCSCGTLGFPASSKVPLKLRIHESDDRSQRLCRECIRVLVNAACEPSDPFDDERVAVIGMLMEGVE